MLVDIDKQQQESSLQDDVGKVRDDFPRSPGTNFRDAEYDTDTGLLLTKRRVDVGAVDMYRGRGRGSLPGMQGVGGVHSNDREYYSDGDGGQPGRSNPEKCEMQRKGGEEAEEGGTRKAMGTSSGLDILWQDFLAPLR